MRRSRRLAFKLVRESLFEKVEVPRGLLNECVQVASSNKVLLQFLRNARSQGNFVSGLLEREERRFRRVLNGLKEVVNALDDLEYALVKFRKPIAYVPSDIDVVVNANSAGKAIMRLVRLGYRPIIVEPYCTTLIRGSIIVDLYVHLSLGGSIIYINGDCLLRYVEYVDINGVKAKALLKQVEAVVTASHAVLKEGIYTLNDYATTKMWLDERAFEIAEELKCENAVEAALWINEAVDNGLLTLPFKMPLASWLLTWVKKAYRDAITRISTLKLISRLKANDVLFKALWRFKRTTY